MDKITAALYQFYEYFCYSSSSKHKDHHHHDESISNKTKCFVAIAMDNNEIRENVNTFKSLAIELDPNCEPFLMSTSRLHVTVEVGIKIDLDDPQEVHKVKNALKEAVTKSDIKGHLELTVEGVHTFEGSEMEDKVIFAEIGPENVKPLLSKLHDAVKKQLAPYISSEDKFPYKAHMTIGLVPKNESYKFKRSSWDELGDFSGSDGSFGIQIVNSIKLWTRHADGTKEGYRLIHEEHFPSQN